MVNKKRFAIVREADGFVVNVTVWDGITPWNDLPDGQVAMECPAQVGPTWSYIEGEWVEPPPAPPPVDPPPSDPPADE
jgi:hypothetical protein